MPSLPDRPRALTKEVQEKILRYVTDGSYLNIACRAAGISYSAFAWWRKRCEEGDPDASWLADFFELIKDASAVAEVEAISHLRQGQPGWQANAWFLERRFRNRWAQAGKQDAGQRDVSKLSTEELEAIVKGKAKD